MKMANMDDYFDVVIVGTGAAARIAIDVEGHGRHEELGARVDLSRTVGWFTTIYPVALAVGGDEADARAKAGNVAESLDIAIV